MAQLDVKDVTKHFGSLMANDHISFSVESGEVLAILGENGAGKSTLMKIVSGFLRPDTGTVRVDGQNLRLGDPQEAIAAGIGMIHQHFMLINRMSVVENLILGHEPKTLWGQLDKRRAEREVRELADKFGLHINPGSLVENLTVGEQQRVEILKAFYRGAKILILDEPTALLTPQETLGLFKSIREFAQMGLSVVFISHKLDEVLTISDRVLVIRRGRVVEQTLTKDTDAHSLARMMVGRDVNLTMSRTVKATSDEVLRLERLWIRATRSSHALGPMSLRLNKGEILGVAGIEGNGQQELAESVVGLREPDGGHVVLNGTTIEKFSVRKRLEAGIGYVPADRQEEGLVLDLKIWENFILRDYYRYPYRRGMGIDHQVAKEHAEAAIKAFDIRPGNIELPCRALSGGNQQKLLLAREISRNPHVLVISQPTRGLDVGAIEYVHQQLIALAAGGTAILLISLELDELIRLSNRIVVLFRGQISGQAERRAFNRQQFGLWMAGQQSKELLL